MNEERTAEQQRRDRWNTLCKEVIQFGQWAYDRPDDIRDVWKRFEEVLRGGEDHEIYKCALDAGIALSEAYGQEPVPRSHFLRGLALEVARSVYNKQTTLHDLSTYIRCATEAFDAYMTRKNAFYFELSPARPGAPFHCDYARWDRDKECLIPTTHKEVELAAQEKNRTADEVLLSESECRERHRKREPDA